MAIAYESSASANSNTSPLTITKPSGLSEGDLMVAHVSANSGNAWTDPSGWLEVAALTNSADRDSSVYVKVATSADAAASDFDFVNGGSTMELTGTLFRFSGNFNSTDSIVSSDADTNNGGTTFTGGVTPQNGGAVLMLCCHKLASPSGGAEFSGWAVTTDDPTWTEITDREYDSAFKTGSAWATRSSTNATGNYTISTSNSGSGTGATHAYILMIEEAANVNVTPAVLSLTASIQEPTISAGAIVTIGSALDLTTTINAPTIGTQVNDWNFEAKASDAVWTIETQN